ncbi:restriction endonuclease subunit S [Vibrio parahaemolyticus]|uniref:restriction endonuclease subunit S n=1 Tax=Vibrio parahaemolyticus TaxID=670 RepID=UPI00111E2099|nr:restriction endonuclease subunit S [Vibrio parahaemolyticus]MBE4314477.1 restriction endonuclease subunit S [Vibrio parahaemolyticus]TOJ31144.1 restriction endonuclease subunit S [Vibrio parahaemolyticus]TOJ80961.1 restriction endonuclease subunit S [Vibrio parahaemolyticus]TOJ92899.1 restriction endonuclease subunit S [Vibrio parahaemolyticus]HCH1531505.1 restriction endonuclease subunit S [Vibrio parahaemolyticus]
MKSRIPQHWEWLPFESLLAEPLRNGIYKKKEFHGRGTPIINMGELFGYPRFDGSCELKRVELTEKELNRNQLACGDLIFARRSLTAEGAGKCSIIRNLSEPTGFESSIIRARLDQSLTDPEFFYYLFNSPFGKWLLGTILRQVAVSGITGSDLAKLEVPVPPLCEQSMIAKQAISIDDKVAINTNLNKTLEQMAQAIFKSWFVDFDPVKAKMNGEQPEGMDAATASLFPEKLVESELGLIPEGWEIHNTQDLFEVKDGTHDSPKKAEEGHYLVTSKHITKGKIDTSSAYLISDADFDKVNQRSKVDTFDILLTMIGTVGEVVVVYDNPVEFAIKNVGLFKTSQRPELVWLFYWHLQSFKMKHYLEVRMAGTTQQYLTLKTLRTIPVVLPSNELLAKFNEVMSPLMEKISDNHKQNQTLSNLRDTLLPKLLSGEIELGQAQELAEVE